MALSDAELARLYKAERDAARLDVRKTLDLLSYYRDLAGDNGSTALPPAHYFVMPNGNWSYGMLDRGRLKMLGKDCGSEEEATAACWSHLNGMIRTGCKRELDSMPVRKSPPPKAAPKPDPEPDLDLSLDDEPEPAPQPTRRRRRRTIHE